jgi:cation diffusion facilitator CzcD-associated flavoprotein CzcO
MSKRVEGVIVIGAGPAGLATSRELSRADVRHVVLERGETIGHTWAHLYDGLVLHTGKHLSALPGMPFPSCTPLFPTRRDFLEYLQRYAETFRVPVETSADVDAVQPDGEAWTVHVKGATPRHARALVVASGIVSNPHIPDIPGRDRFSGRIVHSIEYRNPEPFTNQRVLVVGTGNSAGEICAELADGGAHVTVAVRSGARAVPRQLFGIPIHYFGVALSALPQSLLRGAMSLTGAISQLVRGPSPLPPPSENVCANVPLIGFHLVDGIRSGRIRLRPGLSEFTSAGVRFVDGSEADFDHVILATGYRGAVGMLGNLVRLDDCGFAARRDRVVSMDRPHLYFVGHNYDARGGLRNIGRDARIAATLIARRM